MSIDELIAGLPDDLQQEVKKLQNGYGEDVAIRYALTLSSPTLNQPRRGLPRQHKRRPPK